MSWSHKNKSNLKPIWNINIGGLGTSRAVIRFQSFQGSLLNQERLSPQQT